LNGWSFVAVWLVVDQHTFKTKGLLRVRLMSRLPWRKRKAVVTAPLRVPGLLSGRRTLVIGHRGYSAFAPENTLPAFRLALEAGVDLVELDFRQSADGQLVVFHDPDLDRTTDARLRWGGKHIRVESKSIAEIRSLDAGRWFDGKFAGTPVPLLSEALDLIQPNGIALLERKSGDVEATAHLLESKRLVGRVIVQSFDWSFLRGLHRRLPEQPLGALGPLAGLPGVKKAPGVFGQLTGRWLRALRQTGASVVVWNKQVSKTAVRQAHEQGLRVWVYTINRPELAQKLLDIGVDGLITNNPALIWKTMASPRQRGKM
jgi:glycerophosphoryl diester phosphodiesterase